MKQLSTINPRGVIWRVQLMAAILAGANLMTGCTSWGTKNTEAVVEYRENGSVDRVYAGHKSGSTIAGGFKGKMRITSEPFGKVTVTITGQGGSSDSEPGHKATVDAIDASANLIEKVGKGVAAGVVGGASRGFAP